MSVRTGNSTARWRWAWAFSFIFLAHAALVFWLNERSRPVVPPERLKPLIYLPADPAAEQKVAQLADADPMVFALASEHGFSGGAWLKFAVTEMSSSNWSAAPTWLPLTVDDLGSTILRVAATNRVPIDALLGALRGASPFELRIPAEPLLPRSSFVIEGALGQRRLISTNELPVATNVDLLTNTVVELAVGGDGVVESAVLTGQCGAKAVDEAAVALSRAFLFEPWPGPRRSWTRTVPDHGKVTFSWRVVAPPLTNGVAAASP